MPALGPIRSKDLIPHLKTLGFDGPKAGGQHESRVRSGVAVRVPNPPRGDISIDLVARILRQVELDRATEEAL